MIWYRNRLTCDVLTFNALHRLFIHSKSMLWYPGRAERQASWEMNLSCDTSSVRQPPDPEPARWTEVYCVLNPPAGKIFWIDISRPQFSSAHGEHWKHLSSEGRTPGSARSRTICIIERIRRGSLLLSGIIYQRTVHMASIGGPMSIDRLNSSVQRSKRPILDSKGWCWKNGRS
jgi:hypothetical protein